MGKNFYRPRSDRSQLAALGLPGIRAQPWQIKYAPRTFVGHLNMPSLTSLLSFSIVGGFEFNFLGITSAPPVRNY